MASVPEASSSHRSSGDWTPPGRRHQRRYRPAGRRHRQQYRPARRLHLPPILPALPMLYAFLRRAHTVLAYLLFLTFAAHLSAVLFHTWVVRDRLLDRMALWPVRRRFHQAPIHARASGGRG